MSKQLSWDPSLIKKFGCSNHFKLLNTLRNEVKKYPLTKKKDLTSNINKIVKDENSNLKNTFTSNTLHSGDIGNIHKDNISKSTVSFNNSKNFTIYNSNLNESNNKQGDTNLFDDNKSEKNNSPQSTFKDRLSEVDMK